MPSPTVFLPLGLLASLAQAGVTLHHRQPRYGGIAWGPCDAALNVSEPLVCGTLAVPLDYNGQQSNDTIQIQLIRYPAIKGPSRGSILFNPGGPGASGVVDMAAAYELYSAATGGHHDLIGFDPRGTGNTIPFTCFNASNPQEALAQAILTDRAQLGGNSSDAAIGTLWANSAQHAAACFAKQSAFGNFTGTASVARDMMKIVDALGEDGKLRYWGFSYGTVLGSTAVAMFPDRMDKVILDGVADPRQWYPTIGDTFRLGDVDATFREFLDACVGSPACVLAANRPNATAQQLEVQVRQFIEKLKYEPIPVIGSTDFIDYYRTRQLILGILYFPGQWPLLAAGLDVLLTTPINQAAALAIFATPSGAASGLSVEANWAAKCADKAPRPATLDDFVLKLQGERVKSWIADDVLDPNAAACGQWPFKGVGQYGGDFRAKTETPVLVISTSLDPATPIQGARNVTELLDGSVLLEIQGAGHCSFAQTSLCTYKLVREYFLEGKLPEPGTKCDVDVEYFGSQEAEVLAYRNLIKTLQELP